MVIEFIKQYKKSDIGYWDEYFKEQYQSHYEDSQKISKLNLNHRMSCAILATLKNNKNGKCWQNLVGYTAKDLIKRLKPTMPKNCTWKDYLKGKLHIDHIIPISIWDFDNPEQLNFKKCWALNNLQLLPAEENRIKSDKLYRPFQAALKI